jgi:curved DNA-binding protein CbpA
MKWFSVVVLLSFIAGVFSWSAQDREIFALRESVEGDIGKGSTFYDWLGLDRKADYDAIGKAYKKLSVKLHPDKNPSKGATERFSRLGLVYKILRGPDRERYDFFLDNGFPRWKGTDYYYSRYRPGVGTVLVFLYLLIGSAQYAFMYITSQQHRSHMTKIIDQAVVSAGVSSTKRKVVLENGKVFMVYPEGSVFLVENDIEFRLSIEDIRLPTWKDTIIYRLPFWLYCKCSGKEYEPEQKEPVSGSSHQEKKTPKPKPATKIGAVRRKK